MYSESDVTFTPESEATPILRSFKTSLRRMASLAADTIQFCVYQSHAHEGVQYIWVTPDFSYLWVFPGDDSSGGLDQVVRPTNELRVLPLWTTTEQGPGA
jgi:hypothetical protein